MESLVRDLLISHMKKKKKKKKNKKKTKQQKKKTFFKTSILVQKWTFLCNAALMCSWGLVECLLNFLTNRKQKYIVQGEESQWADVASGIPQGSVLWPALFLIYINDLPDVVKKVANFRGRYKRTCSYSIWSGCYWSSRRFIFNVRLVWDLRNWI